MAFRLISETQLSTRAKRGLALSGHHTVEDLEAAVAELGARYVRERLFNIGPVTAAEILEILDVRTGC